MHAAQPLLLTFAIVLGVAAVTTVLFQRLRQPVIFGYLVAGMIVGPHVPIPIEANADAIESLAELGVVLLMFALGLEFTLRRLFQVIPAAGVVALLQSSLMILLGYGIGRLFGWTGLECLYAGAIVAISSTTIIIKAFRERSVSGPVTDIVFGVLIVEDLIAILLLAILTPVSSGRELSAGALVLTVSRLTLFLAAILGVGLFLIPRAVRFIVRLDRPETTLVSCVGLCFGCALLAQRFGYSVALGAFLAGMLVAESGEHRAIGKMIEPVRDMFAAIFFVSVGMLIQPDIIAKEWMPVAAFTVLVVAGKVAAVTVSVFLTGTGIRTAIQAGMSLAQIGEFSFIIAGVGLSTGATGPFLYPVAVAVSAATTLLTPWLIRSAPAVSEAVDRHLPRPLQTFTALYGSWIEGLRLKPQDPENARPVRQAVRLLLLDTIVVAVILVVVSLERGILLRLLENGMGISGIGARMILLAGTLILATPFILGMFRVAGTLSRLLSTRIFPVPGEGLDLAAAPRRTMFVTIQLSIFFAAAVPLAAITQGLLPAPWPIVGLGVMMLALTVVFWRSATNLSGHARAGAEIIVAAIARRMHGGEETGARNLEKAYELTPGLGRPLPVPLEPGSPAVGKSLGELRLRGRTGATVLAVVRGDEVILVPDGHTTLRVGDILALTGTSESVAAARGLLT